MTWHWDNDNQICDDCGWLVLTEKYYYWCIGCENLQVKNILNFMEGQK